MKIKFFYLIIFWITLIGYSSESRAQEEPHNYIKNFEDKFFPSPSAGSLVGSGLTDVKVATGGLTKSIMLASVPFDDFNYPLELNYYSNGVRVDDWGGHCGIDWDLKYTGIITREVRGIADEKALRRIGDGQYEFGDLNVENFTQSNYDKIKLLSSRTAKVDGQYDIFSFNIFGLSGKFIIRNGQAVLLNDDSKLKVNVTISGYIYTFKIFDTEGREYSFSSSEKTKYDIENECDNESPYMEELETAWFLDNIKLPNQKLINFAYSNVNYSYYYDFNESKIFDASEMTSNGGNPATPGTFSCESGLNNTNTICFRRKIVTSKILYKVTYKNTSVNFNYSDRNDLLGDKLLKNISVSTGIAPMVDISLEYNNPVSTVAFENLIQSHLSVHYPIDVLKKRYFLKKVSIGNNAEDSDNYVFEYNNLSALPHRFSFSQDHYGYFNGIANSTSIPDEAYEYMNFKVYKEIANITKADKSPRLVGRAGLLSKIKYPTGGVDSILYEQNQSDEIKETFSTLTVPVSVTSGGQNWVSDYIDLNSFTGTASISLEFLHDPNYAGIGENQTERYAKIKLLKNNVVTDIVPFRSEIDMYIGNKFSSNIPLSYSPQTSYVRGMKLNNEISLDAENENLLEVEIQGKYAELRATLHFTTSNGMDTISVPWMGYRVSKIISNGNDLSTPVERNFVYKKWTQEGNQLKLTSISSMNKSPNLEYETGSRYNCKVIIPSTNPRENDKEYWSYFQELFKFSNKLNTSPYIYNGFPSMYSHIIELYGDQKNSFSASRTYVNGNSREVKILSYEYPNDRVVSPSLDNSQWNTGIKIEEYLGSVLSNGKYLIRTKNESHYSAVTKYFFNYNAYLIDQVGYISADIKQNFNWYAVKSGTTESHWVKLDSVSNWEFVSETGAGQLIKNTKKYTYNPVDKRLFEESSINSVGKVMLKKYFGPAKMVELNKDPQGIYQTMLSKNNYSATIQEQRLVNNTLVFEKVFQFFNPSSNIFVPKQLDYFYGTGNSAKTFTFPTYNSDGRIKEIKDERGISTVYLWAYAGGYPIAKIENSTYSEVEVVLTKASISSLESSNPTDALINTQMTKLRTMLPHALVTHYTYIPLVGMTSKTDVRGITEYYQYDGMRRLQTVLDHLNYVNKSFDYHYRPN